MDIGIITSDRPFINEFDDLSAAIKKARCNPVPIPIDHIAVKLIGGKVLPYHVTKDDELKIELSCAVMRHIGVIRDYEELSQRLWSIRSLEMTGTYVANNIMSWFQASDKLGALMALAKAGVPVPDTVSSENIFAGYHAIGSFGDSIIKPLRNGAGFGIFKLDNPDAAMHIFSYFINLNKPIYVQKFLSKKDMGDYRVIVVGGEVIGAEFRKGISWKSNVAQGAKAIAVKPDERLCEIAIKSAQALNLDYAGIDVAETKDGYFVLETNPTVSWSAFKEVTKVNPAKYIIAHIIKKAKGGIQ